MRVSAPPPWQMTLREFGARGAPCPPEIEAEMEAARIPLGALRRDVESLQRRIVESALAAGLPIPANVLAEHLDLSSNHDS